MSDHANTGGLVPFRPLPTQRAGDWEAAPGPAYRDLATAVHCLARSNVHPWPPLPSAGLCEWPQICTQDNHECEV